MNPLNIIIFSYIILQIQTYSNIPEFFLVKNKTDCLNNANNIIINNNQILCICDEKYATKPWNKKGQRCNYKRKKQLIVFILEIIGFGIGHLYAHKLGIGICKLIYWIICIIFLIQMRREHSKRGENDDKVICLTFISFFFTVGMVIWYIIDLAYIGIGNYLDGNDIELYYWDKSMRFNGH